MCSLGTKCEAGLSLNCGSRVFEEAFILLCLIVYEMPSRHTTSALRVRTLVNLSNLNVSLAGTVRAIIGRFEFEEKLSGQKLAQ